MSDTSFMVGVMAFVAVIVFIGTQVASTYPEMQILTGFDAVVFSTSIIAIAGTCVIATGLPCAAALVFFNAVTFFVVSNPIVAALIFMPITLGISIMLAHLARGTSR